MKAKVYDLKDFDKEFVGALKVKSTGENQRQIFNVTNDYVGRTFIEMLRKALNRDMYTIRVRGSQSDREAYRKEGIYISDQSVPLKYADRLRVYIEGVPHFMKNQQHEVQIAKLRKTVLETEGEVMEIQQRLSDAKEENEMLRKSLKSYIDVAGLRPSDIALIEEMENDKALSIVKYMYHSGTLKADCLDAVIRAYDCSETVAKIIFDKYIDE